jgi:di/tricarboxylate transporter
VLWITEALPLPATALLGAAACVVLRVAPAKEVFAPFADLQPARAIPTLSGGKD